MAKINIPFNNVNYSIDEASLSAATAALRTHLQTKMNGTGATINFGGASYNVDSTKLSTARNSFVSHLGAIAGSGSKVVVNGVEYSIGSDKIAGAVADIEAVLGGMISGGGSEEVEIFPEQTVEGFADSGSGYESFVQGVTLEVDQEYIIVWNDSEYTCVGVDVSSMGVEGGVGIGYNLNEGSYPFTMVYAPAFGGIRILAADGSTATSHRIRIYQKQ